MKIVECIASKSGISCLKSQIYNFKSMFKNNIQDKLITYAIIRCVEFIVFDFYNNRKNILNNSSYVSDDIYLESIMFS